jgi:hypothetical protein
VPQKIVLVQGIHGNPGHQFVVVEIVLLILQKFD